MSPRPKRFRKVSTPPIVSGFKPYGNKAIEEKNEPVFLHFEEYEALRLCDHELMNHQQASLAMEVSRPTLTRIYARARQKIADALVNGKQIIIEGGKVFFDSEWYMCDSCGCYFNHPEKTLKIASCPLCGSRKISNYEMIKDQHKKCNLPSGKTCVCPQCGLESDVGRGIACKTELCPKCNIPMIRESAGRKNQSRKKNYL